MKGGRITSATVSSFSCFFSGSGCETGSAGATIVGALPRRTGVESDCGVGGGT